MSLGKRMLLPCSHSDTGPTGTTMDMYTIGSRLGMPRTPPHTHLLSSLDQVFPCSVRQYTVTQVFLFFIYYIQ